MAASYTSGPDESGGLSAHEQKVLAAIEYDLFVDDPTLARHLECADWPRAGIRPRAAVRHVALLIIALIILIIAATAVPADWWGALGLLATLLLVPWILLFPSDHPNQD
jgi:peptidoglycan/LPS O-acetylase OafA/YrhL